MGSQIRCIFYSEFDNTVGPKVCFQAPEAFILPDDFASISEFMITRPDLCGKVMNVRHPCLQLPDRHQHGGKDSGEGSSAQGGSPDAAGPAAVAAPVSRVPQAATIIGFPVGLQHERYQRNTLLYSVGFILDDEADPSPFEPVLRKLGAALYSLEVETGFLSRPESRARLAPLLRAVLAGLNTRGECFLPLDDCNMIALKLFAGSAAGVAGRGAGAGSAPGGDGRAGAASSVSSPSSGAGSSSSSSSSFAALQQLPRVRDHDVPVRLRDLDALSGAGSDAGWDLALAAVAPFIDGVAFVRAIAEAADVEIGIVRRVVGQLAYYGCVALVDVFQASNVYATQPKVQALLHDPDLRTACSAYVAMDGAGWEAAVAGGAGGGGSRAGGLAAARSTASLTASPRLHPVGSATAVAPFPGGSTGSLTAAAATAASLPPSSSSSLAPPPPPPPRPSVAYLFRLYAAFGTGSRVVDVAALADTAAAGVDDRRLVTFGLIHGLLRRVHRYPTPLGPPRPRLPLVVPLRFRAHLQGDTTPSPPMTPAALAAAVTPELVERLERLRLLTPAALAAADGSASMEALCCELRCSQAALEAAFDAHGGFAYVQALEGEGPAAVAAAAGGR